MKERIVRLQLPFFKVVVPGPSIPADFKLYESAISLRLLYLGRMEAPDDFRLSSPTAPEFFVGVTV